MTLKHLYEDNPPIVKSNLDPSKVVNKEVYKKEGQIEREKEDLESNTYTNVTNYHRLSRDYEISRKIF